MARVKARELALYRTLPAGVLFAVIFLFHHGIRPL